ncbi:ATP-binding protein [Thalassovita sp.]|uniref:ATP-binding protein n=1 Tax=Thalassovita sp. TaxID=1979401 RepID=UPI002AAFD3CB|nr:ATP-binding protein [Thalassovita sp.]
MQDYLDEDSVRESDLRRSLYFSRFVAFCNVLLLLPWVLYFSYQGAWPNVYNVTISTLPSLCVLGVLFTRYHYIGRLIWLNVLCYNLLRDAYDFGLHIEVEISGFWLLAMPFLLFSSLAERRTQLAMSSICVGVVIFVLSMDFFGLHSPAELPPPAELAGIEFGIRMTTVAMLIAQMLYFGYLNRKLTNGLLHAIDNARQAAKAKGEFLANMSHEIRTPMNGMIGMLEVLEAEGLKAKQRPLVGTIRNSALSLLRIIDDILDASKIEAGKMDVANSRMELIPVIEGAAQTLRVMSDENQVRIRHFIHPDMPNWIVSDSGRLRQVLLNLLSNAVKYSAKRLTGRDGVVWMISDLDEAGNIRFTFRDNGIGMSDAFQAEMFEPFSQGEAPAKRQVEGTGLGLVITLNLVTLMGGKIEVKSKEGEGSEFVVTLPVVTAEGPPTHADLQGRHVICLSAIIDAAEKYLREFFDRKGVEAEYVYTREEALAAGRLVERPVFLLTQSDLDEDEVTMSFLRAALPGARFVVFGVSRAARYGRVNKDTYMVQVRPILVSDLVSGIEEMTQDDHDEAEPKTNLPSRVAPLDQRLRILAVEDNMINQAVLAKQLELLGVEYDMAANGHEGLDLWRQNSYDLVLSDCFMPIMDGFELTAAIRAQEQREDLTPTPIVALTADAIQGKHEACRAAGMDDTLIKPVELAELREKLLQNVNTGESDAA